MSSRSRDQYDSTKWHDLLPEIQAFLITSRMPRSRFGTLAVNNNRFIPELEAGRLVGDQVAKKVRDFIKNWKPE